MRLAKGPVVFVCVLLITSFSGVHSKSCPSVLNSMFVESKDFKLYRLHSSSANQKKEQQEIGSGQLIKKTSDELTFEYQIDQAFVTKALQLSGRVHIRHLNGCRYQLISTATVMSAAINEEVLADPLFLDSGMLHFYFSKGHFFQLSRKGTQTRMVSEYGVLIFQPPL